MKIHVKYFDMIQHKYFTYVFANLQISLMKSKTNPSLRIYSTIMTIPSFTLSNIKQKKTEDT